MIEVNELTQPELQIYSVLNEAQLYRYFEPNPGLFIAESPKVIQRALQAGYEPYSLLVAKGHVMTEAAPILNAIEEIEKNQSCTIPVYISDFDTLTQLTGFELTRGVLCAMKRKAIPSLKDLFDDIQTSTGKLRRIAVLEEVQNPANVGSIFRSAAALNMDAVILTPGCADALYRRSIRVSMGTVFQIPWTTMNHKLYEGGMEELNAYGFKTLAMALKKDSVTIDDPRLHSEEKLAIIMGTEGEGLQDKTIDACDYTVKIPMSHGVDSLNVAAASAIAFYELGK